MSHVNEIHKFYLGMAWEHEFDGSSHAEYKGLRTDKPSSRLTDLVRRLFREKAGWHLSVNGNII